MQVYIDFILVKFKFLCNFNAEIKYKYNYGS